MCDKHEYMVITLPYIIYYSNLLKSVFGLLLVANKIRLLPPTSHKFNKINEISMSLFNFDIRFSLVYNAIIDHRL